MTRRTGKRKRPPIPASGFSTVRVAYFQRGKRRHVVVDYMDGLPIWQWYQVNADPITKLMDGDHDGLHADGW